MQKLIPTMSLLVALLVLSSCSDKSPDLTTKSGGSTMDIVQVSPEPQAQTQVNLSDDGLDAALEELEIVDGE